MKETKTFSFGNTTYSIQKLKIGHLLFPVIELDSTTVIVDETNNPLVDDVFKEPVVIQKDDKYVLMCANKDFLFESSRTKKFRLATKYGLKKLVYTEEVEYTTPRYNNDSYARSGYRNDQRRNSNVRPTNRSSGTRRASGSA